MFEWIASPDAWVALLTLTILEIVLGIDNIVIISLLAGKLPKEEQDKVRKIGLLLAMVMRLGLLFAISWVMSLTIELFHIAGRGFTGKHIILVVGGLFLIFKATKEIHESLEGRSHGSEVSAKGKVTKFAVLSQILVMDMVFSLDSVITAVGMVQFVSVMVLAVIISIIIMLLSVKAISEFVNEHPTVKMLALSFLLLIGTALVAEGLSFHIPKGYIYFAMAFSFVVEMLNLRRSKSQKSAGKILGKGAVKIHNPAEKYQ